MKRKNSQLVRTYTYTGNSTVDTYIELSLFGQDIPFRTIRCNSSQEIIAEISANKSLSYWIAIKGLKDISNIEVILKYFKINILHIQDIYNRNHLPKIEEYSEYLFAILNTLTKSETHYEHDNVSLILGNNFVLTFQDTDRGIFDNISQTLSGSQSIITADHLFSILLNNTTVDFMNDVELISEMLQNLETRILNFSPNKGMAKELQYARKLLIQLGKSTFPIKEKLGRLSTGENKFIRPENLLYFQDVKDHIIYVVQVISDNKEMLRSLEDLYLAGNDLRMNQIMQRLTVISTIFIPLTFLVGLWGMNFTSMPEIHWQYGYLFAWGIILLVAILTVWFLKRYKWF